MEWIRNRKFSRTIIAALLLTMTAWFIPAGLMAEKAEAATILSGPKSSEDFSIMAGQKVTWDCIWFGSYPQSEVVCENDSDSIANLEVMNRNFGVDYIKVSESTWSSIVNASYDSDGDANVGNVRYRRVKKSDAVYEESAFSGCYNWKDSDSYHYFRYDPIKWRVLNVNGTDAFLLADKGLDAQAYNKSYVDVTWGKSTMRSWLNGYDSSVNISDIDYSQKSFIKSAFTSSEYNAIKNTDVINSKNMYSGTKGGNDTKDKIFLLSESEVYGTVDAEQYGFVKNRNTYDEGRRSKTSTYAKAMGVCSNTDNIGGESAGDCKWWLRSPGGVDNQYAVTVHYNGFIIIGGSNVDGGSNAVRPALHLDLATAKSCSYAGTVCNDGSVNEESGGVIEPDIDDVAVSVRIAGNNRYATSTAAADALKKSLAADKFENIIVASGDDYPDALAGSYLAKVKDAPVMLVGKDANTEADVKQYINKNLKKGGTVYLLGGTGAVTSRFEKSLGDLKVERLGGQTRYETNIAILKAAGVDKEDLLVCTGEGFADSLSASAVGKPILLVAGSGVNDTQKKYLDSLKIKDIYLIGGTGVVSDKIGTQLKKYDQDDKCERVAGQYRYLTSVAVAKEFFPKGSDSAVLAYAMNFPDGLAGGPLALSMKAPLILTDNSGYSDAVAYAKSAGIKKAAVLGGPTLIQDSVVDRIVN